MNQIGDQMNQWSEAVGAKLGDQMNQIGDQMNQWSEAVLAKLGDQMNQNGQRLWKQNLGIK